MVSGSWNDPYSGETITDASQLDIDHLVPLREAHESGGHVWGADKRRDCASNNQTVSAAENGGYLNLNIFNH